MFDCDECSYFVEEAGDLYCTISGHNVNLHYKRIGCECQGLEKFLRNKIRILEERIKEPEGDRD